MEHTWLCDIPSSWCLRTIQLRWSFFLQWVRLYLCVQFFPLSNKELHQSGFLVQQSCHPVNKNTVSPHKPLSSSFSYRSKLFEPKCRILHLSQLHLILFVWCYWYFKIVFFFFFAPKVLHFPLFLKPPSVLTNKPSISSSKPWNMPIRQGSERKSFSFPIKQ